MFDIIGKFLYKIFKSELFLTIFSGIIIFILSQIIMEKVIKPRDRFKEEKGKIFCYLTMYANLIFNPCRIEDREKLGPNNCYDQASKDIRMVASEFAGILESHPVICRKKKYKVIVSNLIGVSNGMYISNENFKTIRENEKLIDDIYKKFDIKEDF